MLENLSDEQEEMILACLKDVVKYSQHEKGELSFHKLVEKLAQDENMLKRLTEMLQKVRNRGGMNGMMGGPGGIGRNQAMNGRAIH